MFKWNLSIFRGKKSLLLRNLVLFDFSRRKEFYNFDCCEFEWGTLYIYKRKCWFCLFQVIARIVDGSKFDEFKTMYGETLVTGEPDGNVNSLFLFQKKMWLTGTMHITKGWSSYTLASLSCNKIRVEWRRVECLPGDIRLKFIFAPFFIIVGGYTVHIFIMFSYAFWNLKLHVFFLF